MKTSVECLKILMEEAGQDWKLKLDDYLKRENDGPDLEYEDCIEDFFMACIEEIKEGKTSNLQKVEKMIHNELLYKNVKNYLDDLLRPFYAFAPLRALGVKDPDRAEAVLRQVFEQTILRVNPDIIQCYEQYGFDNGGAFTEYISAQNSICSFVVWKNMYYTAIEDFIYTQTRLSRKLCAQMAEMLNQNFEALKLNYIIEKLDSLA